MSLRSLLFLTFALVFAAGVVLFSRYVAREVTPHTYQVNEDALAETATLLASVVEARTSGDALDLSEMRPALEAALHRDLAATIQGVEKRRVELRVYVTDARGIVLLDTDGGRHEGRDYSRWNDVHLTLRGRYGTRATREVRDSPFTSTHYVAAPIRIGGRTAGVLSVGKPVTGLRRFVEDARRRILLAAALSLALALAASSALAFWIARPLTSLAAYSEAVSVGERPRLPRLRGREVQALGRAIERMREALEGRGYVEAYVRSLTHEIKAPLSAIRAASELLAEDVPDTDRRRFLGHLRAESERLQTLVDRMLELSVLEARRLPDRAERVELAQLAEEVRESVEPVGRQKGIAVEVRTRAAAVLGDRLLLRQALSNLVQNALAATPRGGRIEIEVAAQDARAAITVADDGPGLPAYALPRAFERFYSVPLPGEERRGTGLGLAFVLEVARQHGGDAALANRPEGGALATLHLPLATDR